jgi:sirohydrochlorin cobaltochelatase
MTSPPHAVILFAHGSRDPLWRAPIEAIAHAITTLAPKTPVACAYLELCVPDLPTAVAQVLSRHAAPSPLQHIRILPVFFGMGQHARHDLPHLVDALRLEHPTVTFELLPAAGEHPALTQLLAQLALGHTH